MAVTDTEELRPFYTIEGWRVNHKRVERIWREEGLKVPKKQPKRKRLWLNDGSCVRLRSNRRNHVWSYDFVADRTSDGRPSDADQVIVASSEPNAEGGLPTVTYRCGSLENSKIRKVVCEILEGGEKAFLDRERRTRNQIVRLGSPASPDRAAP